MKNIIKNKEELKIKSEIPKIEDVIKFAREAGDFLLSKFRKVKLERRLHSKDIKTIYDIASEKLIKNTIMRKYPNHSILAEETGFMKRDKNFIWIIDPLDGTSNFTNSNPFFSVSIAFVYNKNLELGVVYAPFLKELFYAVKDKGAYLLDLITKEKRGIKVSNVKDIEKSYIVTCEGGEKNKNRISEIRRRLTSKALDVRKLGSGALECAWVACGRSDAFVTTKISPWDIAAGALLVKEAGGNVIDFFGNEWNFLSTKDVIVTNGKLDSSLLSLLKDV